VHILSYLFFSVDVKWCSVNHYSANRHQKRIQI